jgi:hypothetical protein
MPARVVVAASMYRRLFSAYKGKKEKHFACSFTRFLYEFIRCQLGLPLLSSMYRKFSAGKEAKGSTQT